MQSIKRTGYKKLELLPVKKQRMQTNSQNHQNRTKQNRPFIDHGQLQETQKSFNKTQKQKLIKSITTSIYGQSKKRWYWNTELLPQGQKKACLMESTNMRMIYGIRQTKIICYRSRCFAQKLDLWLWPFTSPPCSTICSAAADKAAAKLLNVF